MKRLNEEEIAEKIINDALDGKYESRKLQASRLNEGNTEPVNLDMKEVMKSDWAKKFLELDDGESSIEESKLTNDENEFKSYLEITKNSKYYTRKTHEMILLMREQGISNIEIRKFLEANCEKELVDAFGRRENLISENRERSNSLKKKYGKKI